MSKGATIAAVAIGAVVLLGGGAYAIAAISATSNKQRPMVGAPPPPPPSLASDVQVIGTALISSGGKALTDLGRGDDVKFFTGGQDAKAYIVQAAATGGLSTAYTAGKSIGKKILSLF